MVISYLVAAVLLYAALWLIKHYIADLRFYQRHQWNFHVDNPDALKFQRGEFDERPISNKERILIAYPFFLVVTIFIMLAFAFL